MPKSKSSKNWLHEHRSDTYVQKAKIEGHRARSVYKLAELQKRYRFISQDMVVVDLGAAPGSWSEFVAKILSKKGRVIAIDLLPIKPITNVTILKGDFTDPKMRAALLATLSSTPQKIKIQNSTAYPPSSIVDPRQEKFMPNKLIDVILSDMSPNLSGISEIDQANALSLAEAALAFAANQLKPQGLFLIKFFQGENFPLFHTKFKNHFKNVDIIKPDASRARSKEIYLLGRGVRS